MINLNASAASNMARVQSQKQMRMPTKVIEITEDLYKFQRDTMSQKDKEKREMQTIEFKTLQEELVGSLADGESLPNLMKNSSSKTLKSNFQQYSQKTSVFNQKAQLPHSRLGTAQQSNLRPLS